MSIAGGVWSGALSGGVNYVLTAAFTSLNPTAGLVAGAVNGFIGGMRHPRGWSIGGFQGAGDWATVALQTIISAGVSMLICAGMNIPITFKACVLLTLLPTVATLISLVVLGLFFQMAPRSSSI